MPVFSWLLENKLDTHLTAAKLQAQRTLGVPYSKEDVDSADVRRDRQAASIAATLKEQGNVSESVKDKEIVALIAYLQRLGTDIKWQRVASQPLVAAQPLVAPAPAQPVSAAVPVAAGPAPAGGEK